MRIAITGSPGTGKTTLAKRLARVMGIKPINERAFALKKRIGSWNAEENELEVPLGKLQKALAAELRKRKNAIVEGHMICEVRLPVDYVVLLRVHPEVLEARLEAKGYKAEKVQDNVFCEGIEYCKKHVLKRYPAKRVVEIFSGYAPLETLTRVVAELRVRGLRV